MPDKNNIIVRKIDDVGRVVIPKSIRTRYGICEDDNIEIIDDGDRLVLRISKPRCVFCDGESGLVIYKEKYVCKRCMEDLKK